MTRFGPTKKKSKYQTNASLYTNEDIVALVMGYQAGDSLAADELLTIYEPIIGAYNTLFLRGRYTKENKSINHLCRIFGNGSPTKGCKIIQQICSKHTNEDLTQQLVLLFLEVVFKWTPCANVPFTGYINVCYKWEIKDWLRTQSQDMLNQFGIAQYKEGETDIFTLWEGHYKGGKETPEESTGRSLLIYPPDPPIDAHYLQHLIDSLDLSDKYKQVISYMCEYLDNNVGKANMNVWIAEKMGVHSHTIPKWKKKIREHLQGDDANNEIVKLFSK
ncbi:MAG: hypothetical protein KKD44_26510 [Proteobacteria bacterium]|nr:hypothetical protein [Pseudomonadota bacterium]